MNKIFFVLLTPAVILFSCNSSGQKDKESEKKSYEETKETLLKKEQKSPSDFLLVTGKDRRNILGQTVVKGILTNKATVAVFKDVDLKLSFYSKTRALLETDKETIFEILQPGESKNFKTKYFAPKGTDSVALQILGAKVITEAGQK
ncbi:MAG TPA: hypothetical protein VN726_08780 [Hanamia sp.]|nr:hypothetical protein [Hanamia sp.]